MSTAQLYDQDFYEWAVRNAELVRSGRTQEADLTHIAEELEDIGRREKRALLSRLGILMGHLLKWQAQPERRSRGWEATIRLQRRELAKLLKEMPSLQSFLAENVDEAYADAIVLAVSQTGIPDDSFPDTRPFEMEQILDETFLP